MGVPFDEHRREAILFQSGEHFLYMHMAAGAWTGLAVVSAVSIPTPTACKRPAGHRKEMEIYDMLAIGYPAVRPRPKLLRDKDKMVHYDYCGPESFRTDEEVRDFIRKARTWTMACHARKPEI